jgi:DNA-directed RNA polymerase subunit N (RpoN/RPB10)
MNCGKVFADQWEYYKQRVRELKGSSEAAAQPYFMDATTIPDTPEKKVLDELGLKRYCCRKHFLTQRDLIEKL